MIIELKEKLAEDGDIKVSDEDIKNYYEEMKDVLYAEGASAIVRKIIVPYGVDGKEKAHTKIQEINKKLSSGESFEKLAKEYNPDDNTKGTFGEQEFNDRNRRYESSFDEVVREKALKLKKDEVSDIIDNGNSYMIIKCIENKDKKYTDLEEAKDDVRRKCIDKKYDEMVKKLSVDSKIRINKRVYKGVKVN
jgi:parvulin-like peptidyl-prolyl isomerase